MPPYASEYFLWSIFMLPHHTKQPPERIINTTLICTCKCVFAKKKKKRLSEGLWQGFMTA